MRAEVVPDNPRYYVFVKYFEENPGVVMSRISKVCKRSPEEVYSTGDARVFTYDCGDVVVDVVIADRGATMYVSAPGVDRADGVSIAVGAIVGSVFGFLGGYCCSFLVGVLLGVGVYLASVYFVRGFLVGRSGAVELLKSVREL